MTVHPTAEQIQQLASDPETGPVIMLNLLRFKDEADGIDAGVSGAEAYARYSPDSRLIACSTLEPADLAALR